MLLAQYILYYRPNCPDFKRGWCLLACLSTLITKITDPSLLLGPLLFDTKNFPLGYLPQAYFLPHSFLDSFVFSSYFPYLPHALLPTPVLTSSILPSSPSSPKWHFLLVPTGTATNFPSCWKCNVYTCSASDVNNLYFLPGKPPFRSAFPTTIGGTHDIYSIATNSFMRNIVEAIS